MNTFIPPSNPSARETASRDGVCDMLSESQQAGSIYVMNQPTPQHPFKSRRFFNSLTCALTGLTSTFQSERNFRIHLVLTGLVTVAGFYFHVSRIEWVLLALCITLMLSVEVLNTAIEYLVDIWADGAYRERARQVKDIAAGACLLTALGTAVTGLLIFLPYLLK